MDHRRTKSVVMIIHGQKMLCRRLMSKQEKARRRVKYQQEYYRRNKDYINEKQRKKYHENKRYEELGRRFERDENLKPLVEIKVC